ncbi:hypothetical protein FQA39_LY04730 [Lamprigera yunnana]|nr:hypothetical protein FQA39_LY04730 [Lamprigera yunnana]
MEFEEELSLDQEQERSEIEEQEEETKETEGLSEEEIEPVDTTPKFVSIFEILDAPRNLPQSVPLTIDHVKQIQSELGLITLCWPDIEDPSFENRVTFPESYIKNSNKEKLLLLYSENFRRQFDHQYPSRKPFLLACPNEVGLMKMVCSTIRPTTLPYPEIELWRDCALFVADFFDYEPLEAPTLLTYDMKQF